MTKLPPALTTRLEMAALNNGFDQPFSTDQDWLGFASTHAPLRIWLTGSGDGHLIAALSQHNVARALVEQGLAAFAEAPSSPLPVGATAACAVPDAAALHRLLRRAFQLSRTLPDELLHAFEKQTASLPKTTEAERLVVQRIGQDLFRGGLLEFWENRCAVTGLGVVELLRASHIKPWADCASDAERLDVFNGLLLAPHLDAVFDRGFISVADDGAVIVSSLLSEQDRRILGLEAPGKIERLEEGHCRYLPWHRERVFRG